MKKHRALRLTCIVLILAVLILLAGGWMIFGEQLKAALTVTQLEEGLYSMEYKGDYGFDAYIKQGGAASDDKMADYIASFLSHGFWKPETAGLDQGNFGCSTLSVKTSDGTALFGRNYDWQECKAMIVHTKPENGYEAVSTVCLDFLGFGEEWVPEGMGNQFLSLAAVYVPLDGMNEKGLCVADLMAGDDEETHQDTDRADLTTTAAIRLLLDYAADVDEAVALLEDYDMNSAIGTAHHLAVSDASGKSVVVEYIGNEMIVTETPIVTNFYLTEGEKFGIGSKQSQKRFDTLTVLRQDADGIMNTDEVRDCMKTVAQSNYPSDENTEWSIVFDTKNLSAHFYRKEAFDKVYKLTLKQDSWLS